MGKTTSQRGTNAHAWPSPEILISPRAHFSLVGWCAGMRRFVLSASFLWVRCPLPLALCPRPSRALGSRVLACDDEVMISTRTISCGWERQSYQPAALDPSLGDRALSVHPEEKERVRAISRADVFRDPIGVSRCGVQGLRLVGWLAMGGVVVLHSYRRAPCSMGNDCPFPRESISSSLTHSAAPPRRISVHQRCLKPLHSPL